MNKSYNQEIIDMAVSKSSGTYNYSKDYIFLEDNEEYLIICYWNLYEKYLRNMITDEEWQKIKNTYQEVIKNEVN